MDFVLLLLLLLLLFKAKKLQGYRKNEIAKKLKNIGFEADSSFSSKSLFKTQQQQQQHQTTLTSTSTSRITSTASTVKMYLCLCLIYCFLKGDLKYTNNISQTKTSSVGI